MNVMIALLVLVTREVNPPQRREASQPLSCRKLQVLPSSFELWQQLSAGDVKRPLLERNALRLSSNCIIRFQLSELSRLKRGPAVGSSWWLIDGRICQWRSFGIPDVAVFFIVSSELYCLVFPKITCDVCCYSLSVSIKLMFLLFLLLLLQSLIVFHALFCHHWWHQRANSIRGRSCHVKTWENRNAPADVPPDNVRAFLELWQSFLRVLLVSASKALHPPRNLFNLFPSKAFIGPFHSFASCISWLDSRPQKEKLRIIMFDTDIITLSLSKSDKILGISVCVHTLSLKL